MEVHKAITAHSRKQNESVKACLQLDAQREAAIEAAVSLASNGKEFSVDVINVVTKQINDLAKNGVTLQRKYVTEEMVMEYVSRLRRRSLKMIVTVEWLREHIEDENVRVIDCRFDLANLIGVEKSMKKNIFLMRYILI